MTILDLNQYYLWSKLCVFIAFLVIFCITICLSLFLINQYCFRSLCALIMCAIVDDKKSQVLRMEC